MAATTLSDQETLLNDVSRQLASSKLSRRLSRGSSVQSCSQQPSRHAARVEKPRSTHNSPRVMDRRRTTTIASKRYTTLEDHWNMMFGGASNEESSAASDEHRIANRPVSWHPGSGRFASADQSPMDTRTYSAWVDRQFRPSQDIDMSSDVEQFPMLDPIQTQFQNLGYASSNVTPAVDSYTTSPSWDNGISLHMQPATWSVPDWVQMTSTAPSSAAQTPNNFLPIQQPSNVPEEPDLASEESASADSVDSDKVLVGMGLYDDPPEGYDSWFASGQTQSTGKGLKLEETWEPPETMEDDDDEEEDDDDDDSSEAENEKASKAEEEVKEPAQPQPVKPQITVTLPSAAPAPTKPQQTPQDWEMVRPGQPFYPVNMTGRSFLLDDDEGYTNEWWYHQLKQPTAQDAGIGYGWL